jgi:nucleoside-diphosphate-sugar epimerase
MTLKMDDRRFLLTGATGIVGCELVRELLRGPDPPEILALLRGSDTEIEAKRRWLCAWADVSAERARCLVGIRGDMTRAGLGITDKDHGVAASVTGILHAGAVTRFDQTPDAARLNNVEGTSNVLAYARRCPRVERIGIVSTAFVAGRRGGAILEDELDLDADFNNEYERSKAHAEYQARLVMQELPVDIYRLSIVVGRRTDGRIARFSGIYPIFRLFYEGLLAMFQGAEGQTVDLIPSDFAAAAIHHLFTEPGAAGKTYHICAGADKSFLLDEVFPAIDACLAGTDAAWCGRGQPLPLRVAVDVFQRFVDIVELTANPRFQQIIRQTRTVTQQLEVPKVYDTRAFAKGIAGRPALALPHIREWLPQIVAGAMATRWQQPPRPVMA